MLAPDAAAVDTAPETISILGPSHRALTVGLIMTITAAAFETLAVVTAMTDISRDLGGTDLYGWAFSAFLLTRLIGTTLAGAEVDRQGPATPFLLGVGVFVAGLLVAGLAPNMPLLILGRVIQGFGSGAIGSVVYAIIARGYPDSLRPRMLALTSTAWVVPGLIGPAVAGLITDYAGWRMVFLGLVPFPLLAVLMVGRSLAHLAPETTGQRDWSSVRLSIRLAIGAALLTAGLGVALPWGALLVGAGLLIGIPALHRLLPEGSLRLAPGLPAAVVCMGLLSFSFFGVDVFIPRALNELRGEPNWFAGLAFTAATMAWTTGSWLLDRYAARRSRRMFAMTGLGLIIAGIGLSLLVLRPDVPTWFGIFSWTVAGLGIGMTYTTLSLVTLELAPAGREGASAASLQVNDTLGAALGTGIGGVVIAAFGQAALASALQTQFLLMMLLAGLAIVIAARLPGKVVPQS